MRDKMNVPVASVQPFMRLVHSLRRAVPKQVNTLWLTAQMGISNEKTARNYLAEFRSLGIIDDDGAVTEIGHRLRLDDSFGEACRMILQSKYPSELLDAFDGSEPTENEVAKVLMDSGKAEATARRMSIFFVFLRKGLPVEVSNTPRQSSGLEKRNSTPQLPLTVNHGDRYSENRSSLESDSTDETPRPKTRLVTTPSTTLRYWMKNGRTAELLFPSDITDTERKKLFMHLQIDLNDYDSEEAEV